MVDLIKNNNSNYLENADFVRQNNIYHNLQIVKRCPVVIKTSGTIGKKRKCVYCIIPPENTYRCGYTNIRSEHAHLIDEIELNIGGCLYFRIYNTDGKIFPKLREIYGITDQTIIPLFPVDKYIPYSNLLRTDIGLRFNDSDELDTINNILLSYDEVKINDKNITTPIKIDNNQWLRLPFSEFALPSIEFTGEEYVDEKYNLTKFKLNFCKFIETILLYTPNNFISSHKLFLKKNSDDEYTILDTIISTDQDLSTIKLPYIINANSFDEIILELSFGKNFVGEQKTCIYGIGKQLFRLQNGQLYNIYSI
jgi:hypothetical protein